MGGIYVVYGLTTLLQKVHVNIVQHDEDSMYMHFQAVFDLCLSTKFTYISYIQMANWEWSSCAIDKNEEKEGNPLKQSSQTLFWFQYYSLFFFFKVFNIEKFKHNQKKTEEYTESPYIYSLALTIINSELIFLHI